MTRKNTIISPQFFPIAAVLAFIFAAPGAAQGPQTSRQKAWSVLEAELKAQSATQRALAVGALGLLRSDPKGTALAEKALEDPMPPVRSSAARTLGQLGSKPSIPKLKRALSDKDAGVALAAAHSLLTLGDPIAYEVYYGVLTGKRKSGSGLMEEQGQMWKDPKQVTKFGFEQGMEFFWITGIGWETMKLITKDDVSPVRAAAALVLADDSDPGSGQALVQAAADKHWLVRAAALEAIARRGDPELLSAAETALADSKGAVRCNAAAAVVQLSALAKNAGKSRNDD